MGGVNLLYVTLEQTQASRSDHRLVMKLDVAPPLRHTVLNKERMSLPTSLETYLQLTLC